MIDKPDMTRTEVFLFWLRDHGPATASQIADAGFKSVMHGSGRKALLESGVVEMYEAPNEESGRRYARVVSIHYRIGAVEYVRPKGGGIKGSSKKPKKDISNFDQLPNAAAVDDKTVAALLDCNVSTVWDRAKRGAIPKPRKIGGSTRWNVGELRAMLLKKDD